MECLRNTINTEKCNAWRIPSNNAVHKHTVGVREKKERKSKLKRRLDLALIYPLSAYVVYISQSWRLLILLNKVQH